MDHSGLNLMPANLSNNRQGWYQAFSDSMQRGWCGRVVTGLAGVGTLAGPVVGAMRGLVKKNPEEFGANYTSRLICDKAGKFSSIQAWMEPYFNSKVKYLVPALPLLSIGCGVLYRASRGTGLLDEMKRLPWKRIALAIASLGVATLLTTMQNSSERFVMSLAIGWMQLFAQSAATVYDQPFVACGSTFLIGVLSYANAIVLEHTAWVCNTTQEVYQGLAQGIALPFLAAVVVTTGQMVLDAIVRARPTVSERPSTEEHLIFLDRPPVLDRAIEELNSEERLRRLKEGRPGDLKHFHTLTNALSNEQKFAVVKGILIHDVYLLSPEDKTKLRQGTSLDPTIQAAVLDHVVQLSSSGLPRWKLFFLFDQSFQPSYWADADRIQLLSILPSDLIVEYFWIKYPDQGGLLAALPVYKKTQLRSYIAEQSEDYSALLAALEGPSTCPSSSSSTGVAEAIQTMHETDDAGNERGWRAAMYTLARMGQPEADIHLWEQFERIMDTQDDEIVWSKVHQPRCSALFEEVLKAGNRELSDRMATLLMEKKRLNTKLLGLVVEVCLRSRQVLARIRKEYQERVLRGQPAGSSSTAEVVQRPSTETYNTMDNRHFIRKVLADYGLEIEEHLLKAALGTMTSDRELGQYVIREINSKGATTEDALKTSYSLLTHFLRENRLDFEEMVIVEGIRERLQAALAFQAAVAQKWVPAVRDGHRETLRRMIDEEVDTMITRAYQQEEGQFIISGFIGHFTLIELRWQDGQFHIREGNMGAGAGQHASCTIDGKQMFHGVGQWVARNASECRVFLRDLFMHSAQQYYVESLPASISPSELERMSDEHMKGYLAVFRRLTPWYDMSRQYHLPQQIGNCTMRSQLELIYDIMREQGKADLANRFQECFLEVIEPMLPPALQGGMENVYRVDPSIEPEATVTLESYVLPRPSYKVPFGTGIERFAVLPNKKVVPARSDEAQRAIAYLDFDPTTGPRITPVKEDGVYLDRLEQTLPITGTMPLETYDNILAGDQEVLFQVASREVKRSHRAACRPSSSNSPRFVGYGRPISLQVTWART